MKVREKMKRFWTLDVHNHEGFTLVELIIVIAILAILSTGAIAGYSVYVKQANIAADEALFADIETAITLAYYSDNDGFDGGYILLSTTDPADSKSADIQEALIKAFGENWKNVLKLKCSDWSSAAYVDSSFHGQETALLGVVEDLTETLEEMLANDTTGTLVGDKFSDFLTALGVDGDGAVADAAVLYVAKDSSGMDAATRLAVINAMANMYNVRKAGGDAIGPINEAMGGNRVVAACAAYYAMVEGYCRAVQSTFPAAMTALSNAGFGDGTDAKASVNAKVDAVLTEVFAAEKANPGSSGIENYFNDGQAKKDAEAYLDVLNTVHSAQSDILKTGELGTNNFYDQNTQLTEMFQQVANGGTLIFVGEGKEGQFMVTLPTRRDG